MAIRFLISLLVTVTLFVGCSKKTANTADDSLNATKGHLFIIGGGEKTIALMKDLLKVSGIDSNDYVVILPMSSEEPDSAIIYAQEDFGAVGITKIAGFNFKLDSIPTQSKLDSIRNAKLVFITGGDQTRFMKIVGNGPIYSAIHDAYKNGATIGGTSAGAAVMSKKMLTGNSKLYPEYTGKYPTIEAENIEITEGLGLLPNVIVDQHFNRQP